MTNLLAQQRHQLLTAVRCISDLAQAVNYLPNGFMWAGKLEKWHIGVLGTVSSIISLYQTYKRIIHQKSQ
jgi:peroxin-11C